MTANIDSTTVKTCTKCKEAKLIRGFHARSSSKDGFNPVCKDCTAKIKAASHADNPGAGNARSAAYYAANKERSRAYNAAWLAANVEKTRSRKLAWRKENVHQERASGFSYRVANAEKIRVYKIAYRSENAEKVKVATSAYRTANANKLREYDNAYKNNKRATDPVYAMKQRIRISLATSLGGKGCTKRARTHEILGCSYDEFRLHLERQFTKGMNWGNRSDWHIDHIVPLASAATEVDVIALNHFSNLRPLWAEANLTKGNRVEFLI